MSASLRLDRSSLFAKGNRNAWFPSISLGWRVSEEAFMKSIEAISNLKLRASYGMTGNNQISYQAALEVLNSANYALGAGNGSLVNGMANTSSTLANSNITWEKTNEFNFGFDLGLFTNRITCRSMLTILRPRHCSLHSLLSRLQVIPTIGTTSEG